MRVLHLDNNNFYYNAHYHVALCIDRDVADEYSSFFNISALFSVSQILLT